MRKVNMITFDLVKKEFKGTKWDEIPKGSVVYTVSTEGTWNSNIANPCQWFKIIVR
jgi:hypothetical protein